MTAPAVHGDDRDPDTRPAVADPTELREQIARALWEFDNGALPAVFTPEQIDELWAQNEASPMRQHYERHAGILLAGPLAPLTEWQCPACGATTRARMADHAELVDRADPTEPRPLAVQARELLVENRRLTETVQRVRELVAAAELHHRRMPLFDGWKPAALVDVDGVRRALDGENLPGIALSASQSAEKAPTDTVRHPADPSGSQGDSEGEP